MKGTRVFLIHLAMILNHFENISMTAKARAAFIVASNSISGTKHVQIAKIRHSVKSTVKIR